MTDDSTTIRPTTTPKLSMQMFFHNYDERTGAGGFERPPHLVDADEERTVTPEQVLAQINDRLQHVLGLLDQGDDLVLSVQVRSHQHEDVSQYFLQE